MIYPNILAFPFVDQSHKPCVNPGKTLRQWYAGLAMKGCLDCCANNEEWPDPDIIAERAIGYTDALIEALNKPTDSPTP